MALSLIGNHSALDFVVPGQGPASPNPSAIRKNASCFNPVTTEVSVIAPPQIRAEIPNPFLVPTLSYKAPEMIWLTPYASIKLILIQANTSLDFCCCSSIVIASFIIFNSDAIPL